MLSFWCYYNTILVFLFTSLWLCPTFVLFFHLDRRFESKYSTIRRYDTKSVIYLYLLFGFFFPYSILFRYRLWSDDSFQIVYVTTLEPLLVSIVCVYTCVSVNVLTSDFVDFKALDSLSGEVKIVNTCFHLCLIILTTLFVNLFHVNKCNYSYPMIHQCNDHEDLSDFWKYVWRLILCFTDGPRDTWISSTHIDLHRSCMRNLDMSTWNVTPSSDSCIFVIEASVIVSMITTLIRNFSLVILFDMIWSEYLSQRWLLTPNDDDVDVLCRRPTLHSMSALVHNDNIESTRCWMSQS